MSVVPSTGPATVARGPYVWAGAGAALLVFAGFARTYYLKAMFGTRALPLLHTYRDMVADVTHGRVAVSTSAYRRGVGLSAQWIRALEPPGAPQATSC